MSAQLSIELFFLLIPIGLFLLAFLKRDFFGNELADFSIRGGLIVVAVFMMGVAATATASIAKAASIDLTNLIFMFLTLFTIAAQVGALVLFVGIVVVAINQLYKKRKARRLGYDGEEE